MVFSLLNRYDLHGASSSFILHALDLTVEDLMAATFNLRIIPSSSDRAQASSDDHCFSSLCNSISEQGRVATSTPRLHHPYYVFVTPRGGWTSPIFDH